MSMPIVLFDLDGTLADLSHRLPHIEKQPKDWTAFFQSVNWDKPITDNIALCNLFYENDYNVHIFSGRSEVCREDTITWLDNHKVLYYNLYMRPKWCRWPDFMCKQWMLDKYFPDKSKIYCVFDDRDQVVKMWRDNRIRCYQVAYGNF